ncbi:hypothetical protein Vadar_032956 [Vaccinium darrowii]|uniref:Uncharacterized protein n=1 Tax=Vaccinium darrowii TaxID=229202 RepID=A0ACB7XDW7_9ERIC|nr:hypothetical protein Vadar_032956 [Vaccinium darrowii]
MGKEVYRVKKYDSEHTYTRSFHVPWVNTKWILKKYQNKIRNNPTWPVKSLAETIEFEHTVKVHIQKVYKAKKRALEIIQSSAAEQFQQLWGYVEEVGSSKSWDNKDKPIITMLENIRLILMTTVVRKRDAIKRCNLLVCPKVYKRIEKLKTWSNGWIPRWQGSDQFEVEGLSKKKLGRPKKARRKEPDEPADPSKLGRKGIKMTCKLYGKVGHN